MTIYDVVKEKGLTGIDKLEPRHDVRIMTFFEMKTNPDNYTKVTLADRIVDDIQKTYIPSEEHNKNAAIVEFEDLDLTTTLTVKTPKTTDYFKDMSSKKFPFEIKCEYTNYGKVNVYATSMEIALRVISKYLTVASKKTGRVYKYKTLQEGVWKEVETYEEL